MTEGDKSKRGRRSKHQRKGGTKLFQVAVEVGRDAEGKRIRKYFYGDSNAQAQAKADAFKNELRGGIVVDGGGMTVAAWGEKWLESYKSTVSYNTHRMYAAALRTKITPNIGKMQLADVRHIHLQKLMNQYTGMSTSTLNKLRITMGQIFKAAYKNNLIARNPAEDINTTTGTEGSHRTLDRWEINLIAANWQHHRSGIWLMLMLFAGIRRGEMLALKWSNVDLEDRMIRIEEATHFEGNTPVDGGTKTYAGVRAIPIVPPLYDALVIERAKVQGNGFVCTSATGRQITTSALKRGLDGIRIILNKAANGEEPVLTPGKQPTRLTAEERRNLSKEEQAELEKQRRAEWEKVKFTPHDLRHAYVKHTPKNIFIFSFPCVNINSLKSRSLSKGFQPDYQDKHKSC